MVSDILVKGKWYEIITKGKERLRAMYVERIGDILVFTLPDAAALNISTNMVKSIKLN